MNRKGRRRDEEDDIKYAAAKNPAHVGHVGGRAVKITRPVARRLGRYSADGRPQETRVKLVMTPGQMALLAAAGGSAPQGSPAR